MRRRTPVANFFDSNILLYLVSADSAKASQVETLIEGRGIISVQVLNEVTNVCRQKLKLPWDETRELLDTIRLAMDVFPVTVAIHERGLALAERYKLGIFDAFLVAAALEIGCETFWSEDMQDGLVVNSRLTIRNPFATPASH